MRQHNSRHLTHLHLLSYLTHSSFPSYYLFSTTFAPFARYSSSLTNPVQ